MVMRMRIDRGRRRSGSIWSSACWTRGRRLLRIGARFLAMWTLVRSASIKWPSALLRMRLSLEMRMVLGRGRESGASESLQRIGGWQFANRVIYSSVTRFVVVASLSRSGTRACHLVSFQCRAPPSSSHSHRSQAASRPPYPCFLPNLRARRPWLRSPLHLFLPH